MYTADGLIETLRKKGEALVIPKFRRDVRKIVEKHEDAIDKQLKVAPWCDTYRRYVLGYTEIGRDLNSWQWGHLGVTLAEIELHFDGLRDVFEEQGAEAMGKAISIDDKEPMVYCSLGKLAYTQTRGNFAREEILELFDLGLARAKTGTETWDNIFVEYQVAMQHLPESRKSP